MAVNKNKFVIYGFLTGFLAILVSWFLFSEMSPLFRYFLPNPVPFGDLWATLHFHFYIFLLVIKPPSYLEEFLLYFLIFAQWFIIGSFGWYSIKKIGGNSEQLGEQ